MQTTLGSTVQPAARVWVISAFTFLFAAGLSSAALALGWSPARDGAVPSGTVYGGKQTNQYLAICRAWHQNGLHPGKVVGRNCNIAWGGREITVPSYEVLVGNAQDLRFTAASNGAVPANPVPGGQEPGRRLYICVAEYNGGTHPGKVVGQGCEIGWGGRGVSLPRYRVLTYKSGGALQNPGNMPQTQPNPASRDPFAGFGITAPAMPPLPGELTIPTR